LRGSWRRCGGICDSAAAKLMPLESTNYSTNSMTAAETPEY
jgi:hypothetical protein